MFHFHSRSPEQHARDYCASIGLDADEMVRGYSTATGVRMWARQPRWRWYLGVSDAALARPI